MSEEECRPSLLDLACKEAFGCDDYEPAGEDSNEFIVTPQDDLGTVLEKAKKIGERILDGKSVAVAFGDIECKRDSSEKEQRDLSLREKHIWQLWKRGRGGLPKMQWHGRNELCIGSVDTPSSAARQGHDEEVMPTKSCHDLHQEGPCKRRKVDAGHDKITLEMRALAEIFHLGAGDAGRVVQADVLYFKQHFSKLRPLLSAQIKLLRARSNNSASIGDKSFDVESRAIEAQSCQKMIYLVEHQVKFIMDQANSAVEAVNEQVSLMRNRIKAIEEGYESSSDSDADEIELDGQVELNIDAERFHAHVAEHDECIQSEQVPSLQETPIRTIQVPSVEQIEGHQPQQRLGRTEQVVQTQPEPEAEAEYMLQPGEQREPSQEDDAQYQHQISVYEQEELSPRDEHTSEHYEKGPENFEKFGNEVSGQVYEEYQMEIFSNHTAQQDESVSERWEEDLQAEKQDANAEPECNRVAMGIGMTESGSNASAGIRYESIQNFFDEEIATQRPSSEMSNVEVVPDPPFTEDSGSTETQIQGKAQDLNCGQLQPSVQEQAQEDLNVNPRARQHVRWASLDKPKVQPFSLTRHQEMESASMGKGSDHQAVPVSGQVDATMKRTVDQGDVPPETTGERVPPSRNETETSGSAFLSRFSQFRTGTKPFLFDRYNQ